MRNNDGGTNVCSLLIIKHVYKNRLFVYKERGLIKFPILIIIKRFFNPPPMDIAYFGELTIVEGVTLTLDLLNDSLPIIKVVKMNAPLIRPNKPVREGYIFAGWYKEADLITAWNFKEDVITQDTTLYAKWTEGSGIREKKPTSAVTIYLNPVQQTLHLKSAEVIEQVTIYDISGRMLLQKTNPEQSIEVGNLSNGIYIIKVKTISGISTQKMIKN